MRNPFPLEKAGNKPSSFYIRRIPFLSGLAVAGVTFALAGTFLFLTSPSVCAEGCSLPLFGSPRHFANGHRTVRSAVADFTNDGKLDIAATAHDARYVGIFVGDGTGNFTRALVLGAGDFSVPIEAADFNGDGNQDLAVGSRDGTVWIYLGYGNGNFTGATRYSDGPGEAYEMVVADFDHDNDLDLAIGHYGAGLDIMLGNGSGGFSHSNVYISGSGPAKVIEADLNNDGNVDLLTANHTSQNASVLIGNGDGTFTVTGLAVSFDANFANSGFGVGDFNGDGNQDVVTGDAGNSIRLLLGDGQGGFTSDTVFPSGANYDPHAADLNGDGHLDVIATSSPMSLASIMFGDGSGGFAPPFDFPVGNGPQMSSLADLNADGRLDVITPNYYGNDLTVSLNNGFGMPDIDPPVVLSAPNIAAYANTPGGANVPFSIVAADNSGQPPTFNCDHPSNSLFPVGSTNVTCTAEDACLNESAPFSFQVNVTCGQLDLSPLGDLHVGASGPGGTAVNFNTLDGVASVDFSIQSGSTFPIGTTTVNYTVTELCGNTINGSFQVTVVDEPPVLTVPNNIYANATSAAGKTIYYTAVANDAVSGGLNIICGPPSGSTFEIGQTSVTCSATDTANQTTTQSFVIYVSGCIGCVSPEFYGGVQYGVGSTPGRIAVSDFNKDGKRDMAVTSPDSSFVAVFIGTGNGLFGQPSYLSAGGFSVPVMVGDFNNDTNPDLAVGASDETVWIYLGNGNGGFSGPDTYYDGPGEAYEMVVDDFDRDGNQDIAVAHQFGGLDIMIGNGAGGFVHTAQYLSEMSPHQVRKADFNNDGKIDLVTANRTDNVSVLLGNGTGGFNASSFEILPLGIGVGDFNGDAKADIVMAGTDGSSVAVYFGDGVGGLNYAASYPTNGNFGDIESGDFNRDGKLDVAVLGYDTVSVLSGDGLGHFSAPLVLSTLSNPVDINVSDVNGDEKPDIITADYYDGTVSVFLNATVLQTAVTQPGSNVVVQTIGADLSFTNVTSTGTTTVIQLADPATAGDVPGGFALSSTIAFEVTTTATFSGPVTTCFNVPSINDVSEFNDLRVLHKEGEQLVDRTSSHDFPNRKICATTTSFSPFYIARVGNTAEYLFDRSRAFKAGSTIPIKLKLRDAGGQNISSSSKQLYVRSLTKIGSNTTSAVNDPGESNPDYQFRFTADQYHYNLKTTGLTAGRYVLSYYAGSDFGYFFTVTFEVR